MGSDVADNERVYLEARRIDVEGDSSWGYEVALPVSQDPQTPKDSLIYLTREIHKVSVVAERISDHYALSVIGSNAIGSPVRERPFHVTHTDTPEEIDVRLRETMNGKLEAMAQKMSSYRDETLPKAGVRSLEIEYALLDLPTVDSA